MEGRLEFVVAYLLHCTCCIVPVALYLLLVPVALYLLHCTVALFLFIAACPIVLAGCLKTEATCSKWA